MAKQTKENIQKTADKISKLLIDFNKKDSISVLVKLKNKKGFQMMEICPKDEALVFENLKETSGLLRYAVKNGKFKDDVFTSLASQCLDSNEDILNP